jgi:hypothetical protein
MRAWYATATIAVRMAAAQSGWAALLLIHDAAASASHTVWLNARRTVPRRHLQQAHPDDSCQCHRSVLAVGPSVAVEVAAI